MSEVLLEVAGLHVEFRGRRSAADAISRRPAESVVAVDGVSLALHKGEMLALVGESGSGKTTTANALLGLLPPGVVEGSAMFRGERLSELSARALRRHRAKLQFVFQDPYEALDPRFTVRETVREPLRIHGLTEGSADRRVDAALRDVALDPATYGGRRPHELSGGQRQRVAIAAALVTEPIALVADEPVSMLDVSVRSGILELFVRLRDRDLGVLMITHDLATAAGYADRIAVMYQGRIVEIGSAADVATRPRHPYTRALVDALPKLEPIDRGARQRPADTAAREFPPASAAGCRYATRCALADEQCMQEPGLSSIEGSGGHEAACWHPAGND